METEIRAKAIANLNPLCTLRYSATHTKRYNMVYSLDPVRAYDMGLVKQIEVDSVVTENDFNEAFIALEKVAATKTKTSAKIKIDVNTAEASNAKPSPQKSAMICTNYPTSATFIKAVTSSTELMWAMVL
jgi:type III restriction enzyme